MTEKMTYRKFYENVIATEGMSTEMVDFAKSAIDALDRKNANRKSATSKTAKAMAEWREKFVAVLDGAEGTPLTAKEIAKALTIGDDEVSTQKVTAIAKSFAEGEIVIADGKDAKKNKVKVYSLPTTD